MEHPLTALSGGQRAKVLLLRLSLSDANVLLLDEPTRNFSPLSGPVIRQTFAAFPGAILSISHDRKYLSEVCDTLYELSPEGLKKTKLAEPVNISPHVCEFSFVLIFYLMRFFRTVSSGPLGLTRHGRP